MNALSRTAYCTTREAAHLLGVSLRTAQLWVESGVLEAWKTEGGHRRIARSSVQSLLKKGAQRAAPHASTSAAVESSLRHLKVLVVEDDVVLLKLYRAALSSGPVPVEVISVSNGGDALIHIGRDEPDLLITDLSMPGLDGFQLVRSLADSAFRAGIEIVVVTGLDSAAIARLGGLPEGLRVMSKPVPFAELQNLLVTLHQRRAAYLPGGGMNQAPQRLYTADPTRTGTGTGNN